MFMSWSHRLLKAATMEWAADGRRGVSAVVVGPAREDPVVARDAVAGRRRPQGDALDVLHVEFALKHHLAPVAARPPRVLGRRPPLRERERKLGGSMLQRAK